MEHNADSQELLEKITYPAFVVKDGVITSVNQHAQQRGCHANMQITSLIDIGAEDYAAFTNGKLCLTLNVCDTIYNATVTPLRGGHLFCLESDYEEPELRAFSHAAVQLREPLSSAMAETEQLLPNPSVQNDPELRDQISKINRNLYQMLRAVLNMSDTTRYKTGRSAKKAVYETTGIFEEILEKASHLAEKSGRTLEYSIPKQPVVCMVDAIQLERAVLNLISNALKYSSEKSTVTAELRRGSNTLIFSIWDNGTAPKERSDLFSSYLREPGLADGNMGIGLGMTIVRAVAIAHGGTVLMEQPKDSGIKITMTISSSQSNDMPLRSASRPLYDYAGYRDHTLLELADVLSDILYRETF